MSKKKQLYSEDNPHGSGIWYHPTRADLWEHTNKAKKKKRKKIKKIAKKITESVMYPSFGTSFSKARSSGKSTFMWKGKKYHTKTKEEVK
tara:strand:- start:11165 stop:11434 length:270 start_codon:yes stop_codon:yes gene_type:complete